MKRLKLRVKWKESSLEEFVARHGDDLETDRVFLQTASPVEPQTEVVVEFLLADGTRFLEGSGVVEDVFRVDEGGRPGMVVRFFDVSPDGQQVMAMASGPRWDEETPIYQVDPSLLGDDPDQELPDPEDGDEERRDRGGRATARGS